MVLLIESIILCAIFTIVILVMSKDPIKTLYNYPPKIQERVKTLDEYKDKVPTKKNKLVAKVFASIIFIIILCIVLKYINGCENFLDSFKCGFILWTIVNLYDAIVLDIIWFCHDKRFVIKGTEDMEKEYHDYWFHIKGFFIGEVLALVVCTIAGLIIHIL